MRALIVLCSLLLVGLLATAAPLTTPESSPAGLRGRLLAIAADYHKMPRVDEQSRWAPELCDAPGPSGPSALRVSRSKDADTHGKKLYSLFVKERAAYVTDLAKGSPVGQIIVKESWLPVEVDLRQTLAPEADAKDSIRISREDLDRHRLVSTIDAQGNEKWFQAAKKTGLFVMLKLDPKTPDTDQGWVYATISADGKEVTSSGRVASCMKCHEQAKHDRLFGVKIDKE